MNNLYIKIENGQAVDHPAFEDHLIQAFGEVPSNWAPFKRIPEHECELHHLLGHFQKVVCTYQLDDDGVTWKDVWTIQDMDEDERKETEVKIAKHRLMAKVHFEKHILPNMSDEERARQEMLERVMKPKDPLNYL